MADSLEVTPDGGSVFGGAVVPLEVSARIMAGGMLGGGSVEYTWACSRSCAGGAIAGGTVNVLLVSARIMAGGAIGGGVANYSFPTRVFRMVRGATAKIYSYIPKTRFTLRC
jgi:uncharacterized membrane protein